MLDKTPMMDGLSYMARYEEGFWGSGIHNNFAIGEIPENLRCSLLFYYNEWVNAREFRLMRDWEYWKNLALKKGDNFNNNSLIKLDNDLFYGGVLPVTLEANLHQLGDSIMKALLLGLMADGYQEARKQSREITEGAKNDVELFVSAVIRAKEIGYEFYCKLFAICGDPFLREVAHLLSEKDSEALISIVQEKLENLESTRITQSFLDFIAVLGSLNILAKE